MSLSRGVVWRRHPVILLVGCQRSRDRSIVFVHFGRPRSLRVVVVRLYDSCACRRRASRACGRGLRNNLGEHAVGVEFRAVPGWLVGWLTGGANMFLPPSLQPRRASRRRFHSQRVGSEIALVGEVSAKLAETMVWFRNLGQSDLRAWHGCGMADRGEQKNSIC